jgi:SAM-dependent methyltransferase
VKKSSMSPSSEGVLCDHGRVTVGAPASGGDREAAEQNAGGSGAAERSDGRSGHRWRTGGRPRNRRTVLFVVACCAVTLVVVLCAVLGDLPVWLLPALFPSAFLCLLAGTSTLAAHRLGPSGGGHAGRIHELLVRTLAPRPGWRVLDIGSGDPDLARLLDRGPGAFVVCVNIRRGRGRRSFPWSTRVPRTLPAAGQLPLLPADPGRLPFADGSFDAVVSCFALHDGQGPEEIGQCLCEILRTLREGGRFALLELFADSPRSPSVPWTEGVIKEAGGRISGRERLGERIDLPLSLDNRLVFGRAVLLVGEKDTRSRPGS